MRFIRWGDLQDYGMLGMNARNLEYIGRYNSRSRYPLVDNKLKTKLLAEGYGLPVPRLRFSLSRQHEVDGAIEQLDGLDGFAMKPAKGSGGKGIWVVKGRRDDTFIKTSGATVTRDDLRRHMSNTLAGLYSLGGGSDAILVEDLVELDPHFEGLSVEGIPDIRVIVFRGYPIMAMLRLATHQSDGKANLHQGAVGVGLRLDTGRRASAVQNELTVWEHPDTGRSLETVEIPDWRDILLLAAQCYEMTELGYLGTDIVLDRSRGPMVLELNARPGLSIQIANNRGLLPRLRHVEGLRDARRRDPAARVDYAMKVISDL